MLEGQYAHTHVLAAHDILEHAQSRPEQIYIIGVCLKLTLMFVTFLRTRTMQKQPVLPIQRISMGHGQRFQLSHLLIVVGQNCSAPLDELHMLFEHGNSASKCAASQETETCSAEEEGGPEAPRQHIATPAAATAYHRNCRRQRTRLDNNSFQGFQPTLPVLPNPG